MLRFRIVQIGCHSVVVYLVRVNRRKACEMYSIGVQSNPPGGDILPSRTTRVFRAPVRYENPRCHGGHACESTRRFAHTCSRPVCMVCMCQAMARIHPYICFAHAAYDEPPLRRSFCDQRGSFHLSFSLCVFNLRFHRECFGSVTTADCRFIVFSYSRSRIFRDGVKENTYIRYTT